MRNALREATVAALGFVFGLAPQGVLATQSAGPTPAARTPVLVELFTSEGCSSCPAADALLKHLISQQPIAGIEILGLSEHVDYWDELGWRDPFSSSRFTERQNEFARAFGDPQKVFTPQAVVDGREPVLGSDFAAIQRAALAAAKHPRATLAVSASRSNGGSTASVKVTVGDIPADLKSRKIRVVVAIVQDELRTVVSRGENASKTLGHDAVVRALETAGEIKNGASPGDLVKEIALKTDWSSGKLRAVAFLQEDRSRRILGSAAAPIG